ncbi:MAG: hypothetical protein L0Z50_35030, partial [Verrucomicrobiales bacterium]|nr:hypothetical protein [Verrucomicrobiales bacterium]
GISSIHLLKTFINAHDHEQKTMLWQVVIHLTFVVSALILAWIDRLTFRAVEKGAVTASAVSSVPSAVPFK